MLLSRMMVCQGGCSRGGPLHLILKIPLLPEFMGNFIQDWSLVMFPDDCFIKVPGIWADAEGTIWLLWVCQE